MNLRSRVDRLEQSSAPSVGRPGLVQMTAVEYRQMSESGRPKDLGRCLVWIFPDTCEGDLLRSLGKLPNG